MKARIKDHRQSPRKTRLVADAIRGKSVKEAVRILTFLESKSALPIKKLLESAVANATSHGADKDNLFVKTVTVDKGLVMQRFMPKARGRAARFARTLSIINLELGLLEEKAAKKAPKAAKKVATKKTAKAAAAK